MNVAQELRAWIREIGVALRRPEEFTLRWRDRKVVQAPSPLVFPLLIANAVVGLAAYGLTLGLHRGLGGMIEGAAKAPLAAGLAWTLALPALYIINSALGSTLDASTTFLAALTTVSFGALAMLASVPINWFFSLALPFWPVRLLVNVVIFAGVGIAMVDVFMRVMKALEAERSRFYAFLWLALVGVIGIELMSLLDVLGLTV
jgi:hypothetical protein